MMPKSADSRVADARSASRASIYLAAALYCDGISASVKIRNISTIGALVEGGTLPDAGALVQLVRGALIVHGLVAWSSNGRCGIKFSGNVDVDRWRATPGHGEQHRVDDIVRLVKAGVTPLAVPAHAPSPTKSSPSHSRAELSQDLRRASALLVELGDDLASNPSVVTRHAGSLQNLDIAIQVIAAVEALFGDESNADAVATKLPGLRRSADQALSSRD